MCGSMVDIQSPTTEITRGQKERRKKRDENIYGLPNHKIGMVVVYYFGLSNYKFVFKKATQKFLHNNCD